jgi:predicted RNA binding protein YcfA (HicA-like mRNA interferase family)
VSPRTPRVTGPELLRALERDGWREIRRRGSHVVLVHLVKHGTAVVPLHAGQTVPIGTLRAILDAAEMSDDDLRELL